jgi:hypothetical protein
LKVTSIVFAETLLTEFDEMILAGVQFNVVFVNFVFATGLFPHLEVNKTLALSVAAALVLVNDMRTTREVSDPESNTAFTPKEPTNDHKYPVAVPDNVDVVLYRYTRLQLVVLTKVMVGALGALVGADNTALVSITDFLVLFPQPEVYASLTLSPVAAAVFNIYFILTMREVNDPESTTALDPKVPTNVHCHPVAVPDNAGAE